MRGLLEVAVMMPKDAPELTVLLGLAKFGVLVRLKNSPRMRRLWDSTMGMLRSSAMSRLCWPGPRTRPTPLFPKSVSAELVPLGTSGAEVKPAGSRYPPRTREWSEPDVEMRKPLSWARFSKG